MILFLSVCCLGVSALMTQLTLMRELLSVFMGNELIFGIVLGNWLLLTGIGSALGSTASRLKRPMAVLIVAQILVAVLPIGQVCLLRCLQNEEFQRGLLGSVVFIRGAEVGVTATVVSCFVLLAPYCLIAGYLLTLACRILAPKAKQDPSSIGQVYFLDNIGDVIGGLLFSFVLIYLLNLGHFQILYFPAILNLLSACTVAILARRPILLGTAAAVTVATVAVISRFDLDQWSTGIEYAPQRVEYRGNSPYGNLVVTKSGRQLNFIQNGVPLFSTETSREAEETVHYAMAQRPDARRVLLISGGISGTVGEILKYGSDPQVGLQLDYVELDPLILEVARRYLPGSLDDRRIRVINSDGRLFVKRAVLSKKSKKSKKRYDVVIVDVPDPSTSQLNRFYTREFFVEVKRVLTPDGVLAFSLGRYENFLSPELSNVIAVAHRTLGGGYPGGVFRNVLILPGGQVFFLASDGELTVEVARRLRQAGIESRWMNDDYLRHTLTARRLATVRGAAAPDTPVNRDFSPVLYYYHLRLWMSKFKVRFGLLEGGLLVVLVVYLVRIRPVPLAMFTTGFAASGLEVVLLVAFQILYGSVYFQVGVIVTMFMLGLGIGSLSMNRMLARPGSKHLTRKDLAKLELAIAVFAALLPVVLLSLGSLGGAAAAEASRLVIPVLALLLAVMVGMEFPLAGKLDFQGVTSTAARLYTADYLGAALGALLVSTLLIPLIGVWAVCLLTAAVNVLSGVVLLATSKN